MTAPKITYSHGYCNDFTLLDGLDWTDTGGSGNTVTATFGDRGDYLDLDCSVSTGSKTYYITNHTPIGRVTSFYPTFIYRYQTEIGNSSVKAEIVAVFSDATTQTILVNSTSSGGWTVGVATLTAAKTLNYIRLYCNSATGHVYYDFVLVCAGQYSLPQWNILDVDIPNRYSNTKIPSKLTNRNAWMGADDTKIILSGDIDDQNTSWITDYGEIAGVFYNISHNSYSEPFQWFNSDRASFKVQLDNVRFREDSNGVFKYSYEVTLHEYSRANKSTEFFQERFGLTGVT
jgi:hypothetical protein